MMVSVNRRGWSDNDTCLGPLVYARDRSGYRPLAVVLSSGDDEHPDDTTFRINGFGHTLILALPPWVLRPYREKVEARSWDAATVQRLGRDWYWSIDYRGYGFSILDGHLNVEYGRHTNDSSTEQRWGYFLPWTQWRHVRHSFFGLQGEHVATLPDTGESYFGKPTRWERERAIATSTPTVSFDFEDFDGECIRATTRIEEREWHFGTGWFRWMSLFRKPKISRTLDLRFSAEVGGEKGSWKGGTLGHGIEMLGGELHEAAFRRYCEQNELTFIARAASEPAPRPVQEALL